MTRQRKYKANKVATIIGRGTTVTGEIRSKGTIRVEGEVEGTIDCEDSIVIHEGARVQANLNAGQVIVSGDVTGNINALDRIEITAKAKVIGDLTAPRVVIAEGVVFEGRCTMTTPQPAAKKRPPKAEAAAL